MHQNMIHDHLRNYAFVDSTDDILYTSVNAFISKNGYYYYGDYKFDCKAVFTINFGQVPEQDIELMGLLTKSTSLMYSQNPDVFSEFIHGYSQISEPLNEHIEKLYNDIIQFVESTNFTLK
jgi:hypothetical protein